jgi:hypothetical protein
MTKRPSNSPIETSTLWEDAGYDCDHCGGRILRRIDRETGLRDRSCFQCEQCGCQWTLERRPLRVGKTAACRAAQRGRASEAETAEPPYVRWLLIALGAVVLLGLLRFGGGVALRAALPLVVLAAGVLIYRYYRRRL